MKAEDLMIGDWVHVYTKGNDRGVFTVDDEMLHGMMYPNLFDIKPIPLTTEILEKSGFVKVPDRYEYPDCQCWTNDVDGDYSFEIVADEHRKPHILGNREMGDYELINFECKFIHELQHALKLCGIEKEIVL